MKKLLFLIPFVVVACGSSDDSASPVGSDGGANDASSNDASNASDAGNQLSDGGHTVADAGTFVPGDPITGLTNGSWTWVAFPGAQCRDGTATGIGVSPSTTGSTKVMIFLEGGGACFNSQTCSSNPFHYDAATFASAFQPAESLAGIFSRTDASNAIKDWNMVYVPYCTGDVHGGSAKDATVTGVTGKQQFVGYDNMTAYLRRIVPTFPGTTQVLLTGESAGGFGAALNYVQTTRAFGSTPVALVDDSGPLFANPTLAACLESSMLGLWGMSKTVIADCGGDCSDPGNALSQYWVHLPKAYPAAPITFLDSVGDSVIAGFFGFGASNCTTYTAVSSAAYEAALLDMRTKVASDPNAAMFLFPGTDHTSLAAAYTTRTAQASDGGTIKLEEWVAAVVAGTASNVGP